MVLGRSATCRPSRCGASPPIARSDLFALGAILYEMLAGPAARSRPTRRRTGSRPSSPPSPPLIVGTAHPSCPALTRVVRPMPREGPGGALPVGPRRRLRTRGAGRRIASRERSRQETRSGARRHGVEGRSGCDPPGPRKCSAWPRPGPRVGGWAPAPDTADHVPSRPVVDHAALHLGRKDGGLQRLTGTESPPRSSRRGSRAGSPARSTCPPARLLAVSSRGELADPADPSR